MKNLDWGKMSFAYTKTDYIIYSTFKDGKWSAPVQTADFNMALSAYAGVLHYGSSCFEGMKAFRDVNGKVRLFRPEENAKRMIRSAKFLDLPAPSVEQFVEMCIMAVKANAEYIPPFEIATSSLYLRPLLIGSNPQLGIRSSSESTFIVMASPVGTYSGDKILVPGTAVVGRNYDRAAPNGSGSYKIGANYAQSLHPYNIAHKQGYRELLFLDAKTNSLIEEFGSSNFFAVKGNTYITPDSHSVLPSITNASLRTVAADLGMNVEMRPIPLTELAEVDEVNSCGTAVVITPICRVDDKIRLEDEQPSHVYQFKDECGAKSRALYEQIVGIQRGLLDDRFGWTMFVDC